MTNKISILDNQDFRKDYEALKGISLNPQRHTATNAWHHCEQVRARAAQLAKANKLSAEQAWQLDQLSLLHDIGKISGSAKPSESLTLMAQYGLTQENELFHLVKAHDTNLPWYISHQKGQSPSDKAWRKLASRVEFTLLCLFMVADRVDCPGGWRENHALVWFIQEAHQRELLDPQLKLDPDDTP